MSNVTVLHNNQCSTSRHALESASGLGVEVEVLQYLKTPLTRDEVLELIAKLDDDPTDLVRKDSFFTQLGLDAADYTEPEQIADLLVEHPRLLQRPVLIRGDRAIIGRPKARAEAFLAADQD